VSLSLLDWRRQAAAIYAAVRATPEPAEAHGLWVERRTDLFRTHPDSPNQDAVLRHAAYDPSMRFAVPVSGDVGRERIEIPTGTDGVVPFERFGRVVLDEVGPLDLWWLKSYGGGLWLPVRDPSPDTYGGGRYVLDTVKGADLGSTWDDHTGMRTLVVDLNFAYNPSCAYDEAWACPLAPPGNVVTVALEVGELLPG
jgi:uncharacterized protein (DUF1684 family)